MKSLDCLFRTSFIIRLILFLIAVSSFFMSWSWVWAYIRHSFRFSFMRLIISVLYSIPPSLIVGIEFVTGAFLNLLILFQKGLVEIGLGPIDWINSLHCLFRTSLIIRLILFFIAVSSFFTFSSWLWAYTRHSFRFSLINLMISGGRDVIFLALTLGKLEFAADFMLIL